VRFACPIAKGRIETNRLIILNVYGFLTAKNGYANVPQYYVIRILPNLLLPVRFMRSRRMRCMECGARNLRWKISRNSA
jgi:hypothetical protein